MSEESSAATVVRLAKVVEIVLASLGVTSNQYRLLTLIDAGAPPMRELSVRLVMQRPNITTMIDGLVDRRLVTRARRADDRRRVDLTLTPAGRRLLRDAERQCQHALEQLAKLAPRGNEKLIAGLDAWRPALDEAAVQLHQR